MSEVDLRIVVNPAPSPTLQMEPYRRETQTAFIRADHPLAAKKKIEPRDLAGIPLIVRVGRDGRSRTEELLRTFVKNSVDLHIAMRYESPELVKEAVRSGSGMGILYQDVIKREVELGEFKIVNLAGINLTGRSYIVYSNEMPLSSSTREFLTVLRAALRQHSM